MGLVVDRVAGHREIVVKSIADPLIHVAGVSGATELGDGRLVLILDVGGHEPWRSRTATRGREVGMTEKAALPESAKAQTYILFGVAGTTYAVPSPQVQHIEMVEQITPVPNAPRMRWRASCSRVARSSR